MKTINIPVRGVYGKDRIRIINRYKQDNVPSEYVKCCEAIARRMLRSFSKIHNAVC